MCVSKRDTMHVISYVVILILGVKHRDGIEGLVVDPFLAVLGLHYVPKIFVITHTEGVWSGWGVGGIWWEGVPPPHLQSTSPQHAAPLNTPP